MFIRSQDNRILVSVDMSIINIDYTAQNRIIWSDTADNRIEPLTLGVYDNDARAMKVMDDISYWIETELVEVEPSCFEQTKVFDMPEI